MTVVVGTAGHIDHGKTTLLRALTGIDADRLPEERRRGMTIDVGYAHMTLDDGTVIDFVDVPGHDRLVGNMLVGAGEIDAALLVVAADDGPRTQTVEHLALLRAMGVPPQVVALTKIDAVAPERVAEVDIQIRELVGPGVVIVPTSGTTGAGIDAVRAAVASMAAGVTVDRTRPPTLAVDRAFAVRGRGVVVTGSLRGGPLATGDRLRLVPGGREVRVRELQVHGDRAGTVDGGGRTALNLAGLDLDDIHRGDVLTADPDVVATDRLLVALDPSPADRSRWRLHLGTAAVDATVGRAGRDALPDAGIVRLAVPVAAGPGDRFVLRRPGAAPVGGRVLDVVPPRGLSRRRQTPDRVAALASATRGAAASARLDLHGAVVADGRVDLAPDVGERLDATAMAAVDQGRPVEAARATLAGELRRLVTIDRAASLVAAAAVLDRLVADGRLVRDHGELRPPGATAPALDPALATSMDRLEQTLAVSAPPPLVEAARAAGCPPAGIRELERSGRIVVLDADLAYAMSAYRDLTATALRLAARGPLTPAAYRDATGTSRKYVMAILEDLDRRAILRRTPEGHVPGPRAPGVVGPRS